LFGPKVVGVFIAVFSCATSAAISAGIPWRLANVFGDFRVVHALHAFAGRGGQFLFLAQDTR
jgi:hypothetical protein